MASDTKNVKLGVCNVIWDGQDMGLTKGGVEATVATETHKTEVDQFGKTTVAEQIIGRSAVVKAPLAETTVENIVATMPGATLVTEGAKKRADVQHGVGTNLLLLARPLILHPIEEPATSRNYDFIVLQAACAGAMSFAYKLEEERILNAEFSGYPSSFSKRLFAVGDLTANAQVATLDSTTDVMTDAAHGLATGQGVTFDATTFPTSATVTLALGKMLYVNVASASTFTLHTNYADALAGTNKVDFTSAGVGLKVIPI